MFQFSKIEYLSHIITKNIPTYGNPDGNLKIEKKKDLAKNDSSNVFSFTMENHWGTHIDAPAHFFINGKKIEDYISSIWIYLNPQVLNININENEIISLDKFNNKIKADTDLLIIKSGWFEYRIKNKLKYCIYNPGIHPEVGFYLRHNYPNIKAIGFDWISISSYQNKEIGRQAHKAFLNPELPGNPILIIEDMNLSVPLKNLKHVIALPIRVEDMDSSPCTIIGVFK